MTWKFLLLRLFIKSYENMDDFKYLLKLQEAEKLKMISGSKEEGFSVGSGGKLGVDPRLPNMKQMGVWSESESVFPNWPHNHHPEDSPSFKNYEENKKLVEELETNIQMKKKRSVLRTETDDKKHIKS
jgi:hypothetical protein